MFIGLVQLSRRLENFKDKLNIYFTNKVYGSREQEN